MKIFKSRILLKILCSLFGIMIFINFILIINENIFLEKVYGEEIYNWSNPYSENTQNSISNNKIQSNNSNINDTSNLNAPNVSNPDNSFNSNPNNTSVSTSTNSNNNNTSSSPSINTPTSNNTNENNNEASIKSANIATTSNNLNLQSGAAILIDQNSGQVLYEHNSHEKLRPASVTKIMSILLIMEAIDSGKISLNDKVPCSEKASSMGGSQIWLTTTETLTVNEMLKCMCVVSANDCTVAMAEFLCGSTENFVEKMNEKAKELGMNDTCFKNCHGIDEDGHFSSAYDISLMSRELLTKHPQITKYTTIWKDTIRNGKSELVNTNKLVRNYNGCTGLKTGSTGLALYNLSASASRDNLNLIAVIMKAPTTALRFSEAKMLLDYGFSNYSSYELSKEKNIIKKVSVEKGVENTVNAIFPENKFCIIPKGQESKISQQVNIPDSIKAPISEGQKIGEIRYFIDTNQIRSNRHNM